MLLLRGLGIRVENLLGDRGDLGDVLLLLGLGIRVARRLVEAPGDLGDLPEPGEGLPTRRGILLLCGEREVRSGEVDIDLPLLGPGIRVARGDVLSLEELLLRDGPPEAEAD